MDKNNSKNNIVKRALIGFPIGIAIGYLISIIISFTFGNGAYSPCTPLLIKSMGNEINAVIFQTILTGLLGSVFSSASLIWDIEELSLLKQTLYFFLITSVTMMIIAYLLKWVAPTMLSLLSFLLSFVIIFAIIWITQYLIWREKIKKLNDNIK